MKSLLRNSLIGLAATFHIRGASPAAPSKPIVSPAPEDPLASSIVDPLPPSYYEEYDQNLRDETACAPLIVDPEVMRLHDMAYEVWADSEEIRWARVFAEERKAKRAAWHVPAN